MKGLVVILNAKFVIRDGSRVGFWKDIWCGEEALCMAYLTLFSFSYPKRGFDQGGLGQF